MKALALFFVVLGAVLFVYAIVARFVYGPTVFGYVMPMDARTVVLGANTLVVLGIAVLLLEKK